MHRTDELLRTSKFLSRLSSGLFCLAFGNLLHGSQTSLEISANYRIEIHENGESLGDEPGIFAVHRPGYVGFLAIALERPRRLTRGLPRLEKIQPHLHALI